jgi:hypothetical protein
MSRLRALPIAAVVAAAVFVVVFATLIVPWLTRDRQIISSTPTSLPLAVVNDLRVGHDSVLCVAGIGLDSDAQGLRFIVHQLGKSTVTPPLRVDIQAPGYRSVSTLASGYAFDDAVLVPIKAPAGELDGVKVCLRNEGHSVALLATAQRGERSNAIVTLDGRASFAQPWLTFVERRPASILARHGEILDRVATFRPFPAVPLLLGLLGLLVLLGVPAAVVAALALAGRADREPDGDG